MYIWFLAWIKYPEQLSERIKALFIHKLQEDIRKLITDNGNGNKQWKWKWKKGDHCSNNNGNGNGRRETNNISIYLAE